MNHQTLKRENSIFVDFVGETCGCLSVLRSLPLESLQSYRAVELPFFISPANH